MAEPDETVPAQPGHPVRDFGARVLVHTGLLIVSGAIAIAAVLFGTVSLPWAILAWLAVGGTALVTTRSLPLSLPRQSDTATNQSQPVDRQRDAVVALIASMPDPCLLLDGEGRAVYQNDSAREAIGSIEPETMIYVHLRAPEIHDAVERIVRERQPLTFEFVQPVPTERWYRVHMAFVGDVVPGADGGIVVNLRDLTQQQRIDRMRADFVANASHELRTPLASLIGFIETLQGSAKNDKKARERFLDIMATQAGRMSRLLDDLLSLNRIEMNLHVRPDERVDLLDAVHHVVNALQPIADEGGVTLNLQVEGGEAEGAFHVAGARDELIQVVQNLIENAIKYGRDGKSVDISLIRKPRTGKRPHLELLIRDYGPGISREHLPRLTERFYRVDVASSREKGGTGLGLAIVKHILNRHQAKLRIESEVGAGTLFAVEFDE